MTAPLHTVYVPWSDVREALDLLALSARGAFRPRPIGNRVVFECEREEDARRLTEAFVHARLVSA